VRTPGISLVERRGVPPFGHFQLIRFAKAEAHSVQSGNDNMRAAG